MPASVACFSVSVPASAMMGMSKAGTKSALPRRSALCRRAASDVVAGALAHLESRREEVNDLNVFPVADGDTGDNMALTLKAVLEELDRLQEVAAAMGNSVEPPPEGLWYANIFLAEMRGTGRGSRILALCNKCGMGRASLV